MAPAESPLGRVLAIRAGALGDTILALPALAALSERAERLELVGTKPYAELALGPRLADTVHSVDRARFRGFFEPHAGGGELTSFLEQFHLVVAWARLPLLAKTAGRLGIRSIEAAPHPPRGVHASDHLIRALAPLGIEGPAEPPRIDVQPAPTDFGMGEESFIAVHPSSGSARKNWPPDRFLELARLARGAGLGVLWVQGEADEEVVAELTRDEPAPVADKLPLKALAGLLARAAIFVGNDSGVSHLAAAAGTPTLALFGATDPGQWAPRGRLVRVGSLGATPDQVWGFAREIMRPC